MSILSKEQFLKIIDFILKKREQENTFCEILETLGHNSYCDCFLYDEYEEQIMSLLSLILNDTSDILGYKMYELDQMWSEERRKEQLQRTPELESWETVYDYLVKHVNES